MLNVKQSKRARFAFLGLLTGVLTVLFLVSLKPACPGSPFVEIGGTRFRAEYACTKEEQIQGLADISQEEWLSRADVMVFQFKDQRVRYFWMDGMRFPIDILWVRDGQIVKMEANLQHRPLSEDPVRMNSDPYLVETVIELPAGSIEQYGLTEGDRFVNLRP